jgi:integrase
MLTGCRRDEIAYLRHSEIGKTEITIPAERRKQVKGGAKPLTITITPLMRAILDKLPTTGEHALTGNGHAPTGFSKMKTALDEAVGFDDWVLHDLRRTFRTRLSKLGVRFEVAEKCLGHQFGGVHGTYDQHDYKDEMAQAWRAWDAYITRLTHNLKIAA